MNDPKTLELIQKSPIPISVQYAIMYLNAFVAIGCGIGMLMRKNLARLVYAGGSVVAFLIALATSPIKLMIVPSLLFYALLFFFLFRSKANAYFTARPSGVKNAKNY